MRATSDYNDSHMRPPLVYGILWWVKLIIAKNIVFISLMLLCIYLQYMNRELKVSSISQIIYFFKYNNITNIVILRLNFKLEFS